ncbi:hypothetical protein PGTUg99_016886 [Puccinia graminis f. sp. tritici]|uniref:Uncharacterized protein n=1 Tax=Puccinia graminis f. sp. tritici TaxID=56615 RepID=A0A5B0QKK6_PUCGR|nr:hypothetical protein PGTUg99_016886 [Puccinia graminis f. sp. tritici]
MCLLARIPTVCLLYCALVWIAPVLAPDTFTSDWWDHALLCDEGPLPSARDLLTAFASSPRFQLAERSRPRLTNSLGLAAANPVGLDDLGGRHFSPAATSSSALQPNSPANPSPGPDLIPNYASSVFHDVSLDSSLIPRKAKDRQLEAAIRDIATTPPGQSHTPDPTSISGANQINQYNSEIDKSPNPVEIPISEIPPLSSSDDSGRNNESSQLSAAGTPSTRPLDNTENDQVQREPDRTVAMKLYLDLTQNSPRFLGGSGRLSIAILSDHHNIFVKLVNLREFVSVHSPHNVPYSTDVPFALVRSLEVKGGFVFRVFDRSNGRVQGAHTMAGFHYNLIKWLYRVHERMLNELDIQTYVLYSQQKKLFAWLHDLIFTPLEGAPIMGLKISARPKWEPEDTPGPAKLKLLEFFAQHKNEEQVSFLTAFDLIDLFYKHHPLPGRPLEQPRKIPVDPYIEARVQFFLKLDEDQDAKYQNLFKKSRIQPQDDHLIRSSIELFEKKNDIPNLKSQTLSIHPRLLISIYYLQETPEYGFLLVLKQNDVELFRCREMSIAYKRLLRAMNYIHLAILDRMNLDSPERYERRKALFQWLHKNVVEPQTGIPIYGKIKLNVPNLAPWEDGSYRDEELFTPVQVELMEYLSSQNNPVNLKAHAASIFTAWYQLHFSSEFPTLVETVNQQSQDPRMAHSSS